MIGTALKKLAKENGLHTSNGVAFGDFRGYATTFWEGAGYKAMCISTKCPDPAASDNFFSEVQKDTSWAVCFSPFSD